MPQRPLFGYRIRPACRYCLNIMGLAPEGEHVLCEKRGVVAADYACARYRYDPLRRIPPRPRPLMQFTAEDFSIDDITIGEELKEDEVETVL